MMQTGHRLQALDVFRGIIIAFMILVNTPGSGSHIYAPLEHADWQGCTPTDLIFPFFLFITGASMCYSFGPFDFQRSPAVTAKILKRVLVIFILGLCLNLFPFQTELSQVRIMGVLQRISIAYGLAAFLCMALNRPRLVLVSGLILSGYWLMLSAFGQPDPYSPVNNLVRYVDLAVLGENHMWHGKEIPFDPEGLLSTLPAVVSVIFGYLAGGYIQSQSENPGHAVCKMALAGAAAVMAGMAWGMVFPINKYLWTSSYVLYTTGWALIFLACCLWLMEMKGYRAWSAPFRAFGVNPLFIYILSILWIKIWIRVIKITQSDGTVVSGYDWMFNEWFLPWSGYYNGSLAFALANVLLFWVIAMVMHHQRVYIKI